MGLKIGTLREIGAKKGDVVTFDQESEYRFTVGRVEVYTVYGHAVDGPSSYDDNWSLDGANNWRIVSPAEPTGPVRTVTRTTKEIVPGVYGDVEVVEDDTYQGGIGIYINATMNAERIRTAANSMLAVADALEEQ